jgi:hypothetical protein
MSVGVMKDYKLKQKEYIVNHLKKVIVPCAWEKKKEVLQIPATMSDLTSYQNTSEVTRSAGVQTW